MNDELKDLGDTLEHAFARDLAATPPADSAATAGVVSLGAHRRRRLSRTALVGTVIGGLGLASVGVAAALVALDEDEVEAGLPGGSVIFIDTDPTCTVTDDPDVFDCVLARAPLYDALGRPIDPATPTLRRETIPADWTAPETTLVLDPDPAQFENATLPGGSVFDEAIDDGSPPPAGSARPEPWHGAIMTFVDAAQNVAGACVGDDDTGIVWTCYAGQRAVEEGLMSQQILGSHQVGPAVG